MAAAVAVAGGRPMRRQMTVAGGLASASQRRLSQSTFSSTSTDSSLDDAHDVEFPAINRTWGASAVSIHLLKAAD